MGAKILPRKRLRQQHRRQRSLPLLLTNNGNVASKTPVWLRLVVSGDQVLDEGDQVLSERLVKLKLKAGQTKKLTLRYRMEELAAGDYFFLALVDAEDVVAEKNESDNLAVSPTPLGAA